MLLVIEAGLNQLSLNFRHRVVVITFDLTLTASELANRNLTYSSHFKHFLCSQTSCCPRLQIGLPGRRIGSEGRSVNFFNLTTSRAEDFNRPWFESY